jgi:hypothetical protein
VYDTATGAVVLFGGRAAGGPLPTDTWLWDGHWTLLGPASGAGPGGPPGGEFPAMGYDPRHDQVVLVTRTNEGTGQTWLLARDGTWTLSAAGGLPPPQTMAWDEVSGRLVLVTSAPLSDPSQTWTWDGKAWTRAADLPASVLAMTGSMATDPQSGHVVLAATSGVPSNDGSLPARTWVWDGRTWKDVSTAPMGVVGLASDVVDHELLAFAQAGGDPAAPVRDTWAWSGASWIQLY